MAEFIESLSWLQQVFGVCATIGGLLFLIRLILLFVGGDAETDVDDVDVDGDVDVSHADADASFKLLSLQGLTGFFMMFGLVGLALSKQSQVRDEWALLGGFVAGMLAVWVISYIFSGMKKLQSEGTMKLENAVGQEGTVYLNIPADGIGKVQITIQGSLKVFDAVSEDKVEISTGSRVKVWRVVGSDMMSVKKV